MNSVTKFNKNESGQAALEAAIILIAFVVVASVFAFAVLSAGTSSTERGEAAIYNGLEQVQSSMSIKGAVIAQSAATSVTAGTVDEVVFTVAPVSGGDPINLADGTGTLDKVVTIAYRDAAQSESNIDFTAAPIVGDTDELIEDGELWEIVVDLTGLTTDLTANMPFTLEVKPPTGAVININRTTPAAIEAVMELR
jgi:flagellin FlaB